jgi:demethylmenaquinone methyltransferase/2-methoxy-6-polyprenyl-1,4-benzoquinol methylase
MRRLLKRLLPDGVLAGRRVVPAAERAAYVRRMFSAVAPRYDLTNTVISAGLHRPWKRRTVAALGLRSGERVLDLCCGTGDLADMMAEAVGPAGRVVGVDFALPMIAEARRRMAARARGEARREAPRIFLAADALALPFHTGVFDAAAVGFGLRNVADPIQALREIHRVLRPGGRVALLEFARVPNPLLRVLYDLYSFTLVAGLGRLVSRHPDAYLYLPVSVRYWLDQPAMLRLLREAGFSHATYRNLAMGVVAVYRAEADAPGP